MGAGGHAARADARSVTVDGSVSQRETSSRQLVALASVVFSAMVLSSSYTLTKLALRDVPPLTIGLIRFSLASALLVGWMVVNRPGPRPCGADLRRLALGGLLGITLYFTIENLGVNLATASDAALLVAAYPALTALLELVIYRRRTGMPGLVGIGLAIVGVCFVVGYAPASGPNRLLGDVLLVVSGIVWALYNFVTRSVTARYPTPVILCYQSVAGAIGFLPLGGMEYHRWHTFDHPAETTASLVALTVLCSIAGLGLYAKGLRWLNPSTAVNLLNLVPLFGLAIAVVALGDSVTPLQIAGGAVVVAGVTITSRHEIASQRMERAQPAS